MEKVVLIVDDSVVSMRHAADILRQRYKVACAKSGETALAYLKTHTPDLILLDVKMPDMDGFAVDRALKSDPSTKDIPVIFVTGLDDDESRGALGERVLTKPVIPQTLLDAAEEVLGSC